jgi:hypothetical protein
MMKMLGGTSQSNKRKCMPTVHREKDMMNISMGGLTKRTPIGRLRLGPRTIVSPSRWEYLFKECNSFALLELTCRRVRVCGTKRCTRVSEAPSLVGRCQ